MTASALRKALPATLAATNGADGGQREVRSNDILNQTKIMKRQKVSIVYWGC